MFKRSISYFVHIFSPSRRFFAPNTDDFLKCIFFKIKFRFPVDKTWFIRYNKVHMIKALTGIWFRIRAQRTAGRCEAVPGWKTSWPLSFPPKGKLSRQERDFPPLSRDTIRAGRTDGLRRALCASMGMVPRKVWLSFPENSGNGSFFHIYEV